MVLTKSEQVILDAFALQRKQSPNRTPRYVADGKRSIKAAEGLVRKGLATISDRETMKWKSRGVMKTGVYVHVEPAGRSAPAGIRPAEEPKPSSKTVRRKAVKQGTTRVRTGKASTPKPHPWIGRLRKALQRSELSDRELARQAGLAQPVITRFKNGTRGLSFENAAKLAAFLGFRFQR